MLPVDRSLSGLGEARSPVSGAGWPFGASGSLLQ